MASGKPALALVMHIGKGSRKEPDSKSRDEDEDDFDDDADESDDTSKSRFDACAEEFLDDIGVPEDKRDAALESLKALLACGVK